MNNLNETDFVIYDEVTENVIRFTNGEIIIFGDEDDAINDCGDNQKVISCTELPEHLQDELLLQINKELVEKIKKSFENRKKVNLEFRNELWEIIDLDKVNDIDKVIVCKTNYNDAIHYCNIKNYQIVSIID